MIKITKEEFINLYQTKNLKELCEILDCSAPTIYKRIKELQIEKKGQGKGKRKKQKLIIE